MCSSGGVGGVRCQMGLIRTIGIVINVNVCGSMFRGFWVGEEE